MPYKLEEKDWGFLLKRIKEGKCTPFLGSGAYSEKISASFNLTNEWARDYDYPMGDSDDLARVAQFVAVTEDEMFPNDEICKKITELLEDVTPTYFEAGDEIHGVLASLPLPVYVTTTYDDLMEQALKSRNKEPVQAICRWNDSLMKHKPTSQIFNPTLQKPLVYHLNGCYKIPESLVLAEDDYLDLLVAISKEQDLLPPRIQQAFGGTSLLLLGYKVTDWDFRVLCRILDDYIERGKRKHISVQLVPRNVSETQKEKAQIYLDRYFENLHIQVYWLDCHEFAAELKTRWQVYDCSTTQKDTNCTIGNARILEPVRTVFSSANVDQFNTEYGRPKEANVISILFLAADPTYESHLRLGEEFDEIYRKLESSTLRDRFKLELPRLSVRSDEILKALLKLKPHIVHFSGHGTSSGELCIENEVGEIHTVKPDVLASLFKQFSDQVNCVLLNACYSEIQAEAVSKYIKYVIGMNREIHDEAAIAFAKGFYIALGEGSSIEDAYNCGCLEIQLQNLPGHITPVLIKKDSLPIISAQ